MTAFQIEFVLEPASVSAAVEQAQERIEAEGVDARASLHVGLTLDELLTNAATHGGGQGQPAQIRLEVLPDRVAVEILDPAAPYDPRNAPKPDLDASLQDRAIGGLGVHLVIKLSQDLAWTRDENRNRTTYWIARPGTGA